MQSITEHRFYGLFVAICYGVVSIAITLFNKAVFNIFHFRFPLTLFIAQMLISLFLVSLLKFLWPDRFGFPDLNRSTAAKLLPLAIGWWTYGISGIIALRFLNVPMFSALRRFTTIIVMFGEYVFRGRLPPWQQQLAVAMMCVGAALAGLTDLTYSLPGYFWAMVIPNRTMTDYSLMVRPQICALSTATYLLFIDKLGRESGLNDFGLMFYNNILSFPLMFCSWLVADEPSGVMEYSRLHDPDFQFFFFLAAVQAFLLNFLIFHCTRVNSPLVTSLTGPGKDLIINAAGMTFFKDYRYSHFNMAAIGVCLMSSAWYSRLKYVAFMASFTEAPKAQETKGAESRENHASHESSSEQEQGLLLHEKTENKINHVKHIKDTAHSHVTHVSETDARAIDVIDLEDGEAIAKKAHPGLMERFFHDLFALGGKSDELNEMSRRFSKAT